MVETGNFKMVGLPGKGGEQGGWRREGRGGGGELGREGRGARLKKLIQF